MLSHTMTAHNRLESAIFVFLVCSLLTEDLNEDILVYCILVLFSKMSDQLTGFNVILQLSCFSETNLSYFKQL